MQDIAKQALSTQDQLTPTPEHIAGVGNMVEAERASIVNYMRHMAGLRPSDANGLRVIASDVEALFHHDKALNPSPPQKKGDA